MTDKIKQKVDGISDLLLSHIENDAIFSEQGDGLYNGRMGILFFLAHYLRENEDPKKSALFDKYLERCFDIWSNGIPVYTFCSGLAGVMAGLRYLNTHGILEIDYSDFEKFYTEYLYQRMADEWSRQHYDFMHGALGVGLYYYDNPRFVTTVLDHLEQSAETDGNKLKWESSLGLDKGRGYNIALSHGMSSIALVLSRMYGHAGENDRKRMEKLITGTVNYILSQEIDHEEYGGFFVSQSLENEDSVKSRGRLGWCYGDLGVSVALWQAGKTLDNPAWKQKALEAMRFTATRRDLRSNGVNDAGLCHGSAGIAMMFDYMYRETGEAVFKETHDYWIAVTLDMARFPDGYAGYKKYSAMEDVQWDNSYSLLEGVAGIGMALWSVGKSKRDHEWTDLFLLG